MASSLSACGGSAGGIGDTTETSAPLSLTDNRVNPEIDFEKSEVSIEDTDAVSAVAAPNSEAVAAGNTDIESIATPAAAIDSTTNSTTGEASSIEHSTQASTTDNNIDNINIDITAESTTSDIAAAEHGNSAVAPQIANSIEAPPTADTTECQVAPALPPVAESDPGKSIVSIKPGDDLSSAVYEAPPNTVILIEAGEYVLDNVLVVSSDNVTIRGNSDNCNDIRLIGMGMDNPAGADIVPHGIYTEANFLKVQNLTIENVYYHAIAIQAQADAPQIYNVAMLDTGEQFVKASGSDGNGSNNGRLEYSVIKYTNGTAKTDHGGGMGYTQGISLHGGANWVISNNRFENLNTPDNADHLWNPAVLVWDMSSNTIVENNVFINVDRAIAFGLWEREDGQHDHSGGIIRNNMIMMRENLYSQTRKNNADAPIIVWNSPNTLVLHNTVLSNGNTPLAIELRFDSNGAVIRNNLTDAPTNDRSTNSYIDEDNILFNDSSIFRNPTAGDLHLESDVDGLTVVTLDNAVQDIDGKTRRPVTTDAGAHELE